MGTNYAKWIVIGIIAWWLLKNSGGFAQGLKKGYYSSAPIVSPIEYVKDRV